MEVILSISLHPYIYYPPRAVIHIRLSARSSLCSWSWRWRNSSRIRSSPPLPLIFTRETPPGHRCHLMPQLRRPCGCRIHYSVHGPSDGTPVLLLAPGGMRSCIANWMGQPYDPWSRLPGLGGGSKYKVVAMDQRAGAGDSDHLPLPTSWATFRDDQLAVLDATAGDRKCLLVGSCIG